MKRMIAVVLAGLVFTAGTALADARNCLSFNGTSQWVDVPGAIIPSSGDFTVECWAYCPVAPDSYREILSQGTSGNAFYIGTDLSNNIRLGDTWTSTGVSFPMGGWHHVAVVKSAADTVFYLDGTNRLELGSAIANPSVTDFRFARQYGSHDEYWPGMIDETRIWNTARSETEIRASMHVVMASDESGLLACWHFDETSGSVLPDATVNGSDGTLTNMADTAWTASGAPLVYTLPVVVITNADASVTGDITTYGIAGTNNPWVVGAIAWTNAANTANGTVNVSGSTFQVSGIPLVFGTNDITVFGTNSAGNVASDSVMITRTRLDPAISPIHYVSPTGGNEWPYTNWISAATNIQDAIDTAAIGDTVLVTNNLYNLPGWTVPYVLTAEVTVSRAITIKSVNGPNVTVLDGQFAHRCFNLGSTDCILSGFTIQCGNAGTNNGGGVFCSTTTPVITNCVFSDNRAGSGAGSCGGTLFECWFTGNSATECGGGSYGGMLNYCTISNNSAQFGGGVGSFDGTLNHCAISDNSAQFGGGVFCADGGILDHCTVSSNSAYENGGGVYCGSGGILDHCTITSNSAEYNGGGVYCDEGGILNHCTLSGNSAFSPMVYGGGGGGVYCDEGGTLNHCAILKNSADRGGGMRCFNGGILNNCTVAGNSGDNGSGVSCYKNMMLNNCIVWGNTGPSDKNIDYYNDATNNIIRYTCAPDGVTNGIAGCITSSPQFIDATNGNCRLMPGSPCIDTGSNIYAPGDTDLDNKARIIHETVDMGAYEYAGFIIDSDGDSQSDYDEYVADTSAIDSNDWFQITLISNSSVFFRSSSNRFYTLLSTTNLAGGVWVTNDTCAGIGGADSISCTNNVHQEFFKLQVEVP